MIFHVVGLIAIRLIIHPYADQFHCGSDERNPSGECVMVFHPKACNVLVWSSVCCKRPEETLVIYFEAT